MCLSLRSLYVACEGDNPPPPRERVGVRVTLLPRYPSSPNDSRAISTMYLLMDSDEVAPGDGAFRT